MNVVCIALIVSFLAWGTSIPLRTYYLDCGDDVVIGVKNVALANLIIADQYVLKSRRLRCSHRTFKELMEGRNTTVPDYPYIFRVNCAGGIHLYFSRLIEADMAVVGKHEDVSPKIYCDHRYNMWF